MEPVSSADTVARDRQLAERIRHADADAFDELVVLYYSALVNYAIHHTHYRDDAEDVVQDIFVQLWAMRAKWDIGTGNVAAYLYRAVRNRVIRIRRRAQLADQANEAAGTDVISQSAVENSADEATHISELQRRIDETFATLPELTREIYHLNRDRQLTYQEIAEVLGVSFNAVRAQMARVQRTFARELEDWRPTP